MCIFVIPLLYLKQIIMMGRRNVYQKGEKVGDCIYIQELPKTSYGKRRALFQCQCGNIFEAQVNNINRKVVTNCGCIKYAHMCTHNLTNHPYYRRWQQMKRRCYDKKDISYKYYGSRGITVCDEWLLFSNCSLLSTFVSNS